MIYTNKTISYYNQNAEEFVRNTINADMSAIREEFLMMIPRGGMILDLGCGSGRDSKSFIDSGYKVVMIDGSIELCKAAQELTKQEVICSTFQEYQPKEIFDGIWACASLLHLQRNNIFEVVKRLANHLNVGGCFYMSFKYGNFSGERNGRYFTDLNEYEFNNIVFKIDDLKVYKMIITNDVRINRIDEKWLNVYLNKT